MATKIVPQLEITQVVLDRMHVWIKCPVLKKTSLSYTIINTQKATVRKGSFVGESIQLNLLHIPDGNYSFNLLNAEGNEYSLPFVKKTLI